MHRRKPGSEVSVVYFGLNVCPAFKRVSNGSSVWLRLLRMPGLGNLECFSELKQQWWQK